jgi:hypothetical protein
MSDRIECLAVDAITPFAKTYVLVPSTGDFDCDGVIDNECAPFAFEGELIDTSTHCVTPSAKFPADRNVCVAGHAIACSDLSFDPADDRCAEGRASFEPMICVPSALCPDPNGGNANDALTHLATLKGMGAPRIQCTLFGEQQPTGELTPCLPDSSIELPLHDSTITNCEKPPGFIDFNSPELVQDPERLYDEGGDGVPLQQGGAKIEITEFAGCGLRVGWSGQTMNVVEDIPTIMKVFVELPSGERRSMFVPVSFNFAPGCQQPAGSCLVDTSIDSLYDCAR